MRALLFFFSIFFFISCASNRLASEENERRLLLKTTDPDEIGARDLNQLPEIYLTEDSALQDNVNSEGYVGSSYYTGSDDVRVSASINFSQDYEDPTKVQVYDLQYLSRIDGSYREYWWGLQFKQTSAKYSAIAEESISDTIVDSRGDSEQSSTIIGLGLGHRFRALASQFLTERFFENVNVFGNYVTHSESASGKIYQGYGYTAEYGLNYRTSKAMFYGGKLSYNWTFVERPTEEDEKLSERSLVFGWLTLGFELGFYF